MNLRSVDFQLRLAIFDLLLTSLDDDGSRLGTLGFDPDNYQLASGSYSFARDFFVVAEASSIGAQDPHEAFLAYLVNYLLSLSLSPEAKTFVGRLELLVVVDAALGLLRRSRGGDFDPYQDMSANWRTNKRKRKPPDLRCITLFSW